MIRIFTIIFFVALYGQLVAQDLNSFIPLQGRLAQSPNEPISDSLTLRIGLTNSLEELLFEENHFISPTQFGLFKILIGNGVPTDRGIFINYEDLKWTKEPINITIDKLSSSGIEFIGSTQLKYAPLSFHSKTVSPIKSDKLVDVDSSNRSYKFLQWENNKWQKIDTLHFTVDFVSNSTYSDTSAFSGRSKNILLTTGNREGTDVSIGTNLNSGLQLSVQSDIKFIIGPNGTISNNESTVVKDGVFFNSNGGFLIENSSSTNENLLRNENPTLIWNPHKSNLTIGINERASSLGEYSLAFGRFSSSLKNFALASGDSCITIGESQVAFGHKASTASSFTGSGGTGIAVGYFSQANATRSVSLGYKTKTLMIGSAGSTAVSMGFGTEAQHAAAVALGKNTFASGLVSMALGTNASNNGYNGSFIYSDKSSDSIVSNTAKNQFMVRATGGIYFFADSLAVSGVFIENGGGAWSNLSDKNTKENVIELQAYSVSNKIMNLQIYNWSYLTDKYKRHIGPMAQDFYDSFQLGTKREAINTADLDGICIAAIKDVHLKIEKIKNNFVEVKDVFDQSTSLDIELKDLNTKAKKLILRAEKL